MGLFMFGVAAGALVYFSAKQALAPTRATTTRQIRVVDGDAPAVRETVRETIHETIKVVDEDGKHT